MYFLCCIPKCPHLLLACKSFPLKVNKCAQSIYTCGVLCAYYLQMEQLSLSGVETASLGGQELELTFCLMNISYYSALSFCKKKKKSKIKPHNE